MTKDKSQFGEKLQTLRQYKDVSQKDFADFLGIPQPTLSAYEKGRISPNTEALITIATKCNVTIDWLCGLSQLKKASDMVEFFYGLMEINEIKPEIEINDKFFNDMETETDKWCAKITFYGNDRKHPHNSTLCNILRAVHDDYIDLAEYRISREDYYEKKDKCVAYYSTSSFTLKEFPELSREEILRIQRERIEKELREIQEAREGEEANEE